MEEFKREMKTLTVRLKEAENRAEQAEKSVKRLQKEVDRLEGMATVTIRRLSETVYNFQVFQIDFSTIQGVLSFKKVLTFLRSAVNYSIEMPFSIELPIFLSAP